MRKGFLGNIHGMVNSFYESTMTLKLADLKREFCPTDFLICHQTTCGIRAYAFSER